MGYKLETTALISIDNYNAFRIRCIMLIVGKLNNFLFSLLFKNIFFFHAYRTNKHILSFKHSVFIFFNFFYSLFRL
ncbi:hypothetical protein FJU65_16405 [Acinetobacter baumannii]|nr:hypothetical protein FJU65_16405 [Acinetobacter baumannii]